MRLNKLVVWTIGVAICVTPIFSSLHAQEVSSQAQVRLDIQALQREIAQLRDQVERQNFEIRKLKRSLEQAGQVGLSQNNRDVYVGQSSPLGSSNQARPSSSDFEQSTSAQRGSGDAGGTGVSQNPAAVIAPQTATASGQTQVYDGSYQAPNQTINPSQASGPRQASPQDDFYNPYDPNTEVPQGAVVSATSQQATVENRVITAPALDSQNTTLPPVVDRSIGNPNTVANTTQISSQAVVPSQTANVSRGSTLNIPAGAGSDGRAFDPSQAGVVNSGPSGGQNGGIVAIPNDPAIASNSTGQIGGSNQSAQGQVFPVENIPEPAATVD